MFLTGSSPPQDFVNRTPGGVAYGTNMPPELMQNHPYGRLPYGQQNMGMYTQNQPLPPGEQQTCLLAVATSESFPQPESLNRSFFCRGSRFRTSLQTRSQSPDEDDAHSTQLPWHDAGHTGKHGWHDGTGEAVSDGVQASAHHATGPDAEAAASGPAGKYLRRRWLLKKFRHAKRLSYLSYFSSTII